MSGSDGFGGQAVWREPGGKSPAPQSRRNSRGTGQHLLSPMDQAVGAEGDLESQLGGRGIEEKA